MEIACAHLASVLLNVLLVAEDKSAPKLTEANTKRTHRRRESVKSISSSPLLLYLFQCLCLPLSLPLQLSLGICPALLLLSISSFAYAFAYPLSRLSLSLRLSISVSLFPLLSPACTGTSHRALDTVHDQAAQAQAYHPRSFAPECFQDEDLRREKTA